MILAHTGGGGGAAFILFFFGAIWLFQQWEARR